MSLRRWARPMARLGRTRAVAPRRMRQFSSFQRDIDDQRRGPTRYWLRMALLGLVVGSSGALLGSDDRQRAARAVLSLGRILAEIAYDQGDHSSEDAKEAASAEHRIASILATMAQEQTFRQALVAHGGVQVLLKALPHANDLVLRNRILAAIASVATTPGTDAALADLETTSHLLLHLPAADIPLLDRLKIDLALKHAYDAPSRAAISVPTDVVPTVHRLASAAMLAKATGDERKFALQSLTSLLLAAESQSASAALDTALRTLLSNAQLLATLRQLSVTPSPLQGPAATLLVALYRLSGLCGISLQAPSTWHAQFVSWAYVDAPAVHVAAAEAWHLIAKQSPDVLLSSKAAQDALLQLARATFTPSSRTPSVQMHICAILSALGDRFTDGFDTTMATPMSRVFRDADVPDAAELDATPVFGWVDVLTQWSFHGTSAVRHHAIQSLSHLALRQDASHRVLQAWMLGLLRELFAAPDMVAEERRAVHEVEVLANMTSETTPGHVNVSYNDAVLEAGMAAMAILAEKHAPDFIWKGGVDLLSLVAVTSPPAIKAQCARILANLATYPWQPQDLERDVQRILVQEATGGSLFFDEICHWRDEPNVNIRSSYYRAATNLAALQASSASEEDDSPPTVYREGIHPIVAQSSASSTTMPPVDVVFVHGLRGHPFGTWRSDMASTDMVNSPIWPEALLAPDLSPDSRLVTLGYEAGMVTWSSPWPSLTLPQRAQIMLEALEAARIGRADGPPVIFVTHSMGGLLVKEMLVLAKAQERSLASRTAGVVFMAVPHFGANVSSNVNARAIRALIQAHPATKDLSANAPHLLALHKAYQALQIPSLSLGEGQPAPLALGVRSMVVLPDSANPGGPLDAFHLLSSTDHMDICKPQTVDDPRYRLVIDFLRACVA